MDNGYNTTWNSIDLIGNYWSDYGGVDRDADGIGDTDLPHFYDYYPLTDNTTPFAVVRRDIPFWFSFILFISLIAIISRFNQKANFFKKK